MSIPPNQFRRDHPWMRFVLLDSSAGPVLSQAKVTQSHKQKLLQAKVTSNKSYSHKQKLLLLVTGRALLMSPKGRNASRDGLV